MDSEVIQTFLKSDTFLKFKHEVNQARRKILKLWKRDQVFSCMHACRTENPASLKKCKALLIECASYCDKWKAILKTCNFDETKLLSKHVICLLRRELKPMKNRHGAIALDANGTMLGKAMNKRGQCAERILLQNLKEKQILNKCKYLLVIRTVFVGNKPKNKVALANSYPCSDCVKYSKEMIPHASIVYSNKKRKLEDVEVCNLRENTHIRLKKRLKKDKHLSIQV